MHLRSITLKGFKSFPHRTRLEFGPGVSVIVGPNGSGKSNVTDAVLWALGEQSPVAVRGQTMKDVIFAGGHGIKGSGAAEVEVVIDNSGSEATGAGHEPRRARRLDSDFAEISILRRLRADGEGEYRLNGARCRLVDVLEVLSDSGLGREMHSVVSQGKVEAIVLSRPRERRLLIEEAAGLGKHRKRRRRAQLKLERTEENLSRALDVEREARSRLRPLRRQAEAAELHERIERQSLEARRELGGDRLRAARSELAAAESRAAAARADREDAERTLAAVAERRERAEQEFAAHAGARERLQAEVFGARSAAERVALRMERATEHSRAAAERAARRRSQLELLERGEGVGDAAERAAARVAELEGELRALESAREERGRAALAELEAELERSRARHDELEAVINERQRRLEEADRAAEHARAELRAAERAVHAARAGAAAAGAELAAANQFVRSAGGERGGARLLGEALRVDAGYEAALAAVLGPLLASGVVDDLAAGEQLLDAGGAGGASALVASRVRGRPAGRAPASGAERLLTHVQAEPQLVGLAERLLGDVWVVRSVAEVSEHFDGIAVTRAGRMLDASRGQLLQARSGGVERLLEEVGRRDELVAACERAAEEESRAGAELERRAAAVAAADAGREQAEDALRAAQREAREADEALGRCEWLIARRREAPEEGPEAVRRAELAAELRAERAVLERAESERRKRRGALEALRTGIERDAELKRAAERAARVLRAAHEAVAGRADALASELEAGAAEGERTAAALRELAHEEAELQGRLARTSEAVTVAEVAAQQVRDAAGDAERELRAVAERLGLDPKPRSEPLTPEERGALEARVERLRRRSEQLGPVNPLARQEYEEAVTHVEELERQRRDLESALAELEGLIRDTDRRIRESFEQTFEAAARNFEDVVQYLFPGGRGRLRLVRAAGTRPVIGGEQPDDEARDPAGDDDDPGEPGVEVEVMPAGRATRRLSLLSGGEKSLVALAFMFAVFLARPCPFYILDEVEAALDDVNIDRFLTLLRRYSDRAQFIVVTHQKRTMDAADTLYGVTMAGDGVSRVVSRRLSAAPSAESRAA
jgi:chromosome segregation protein